jgi:hypothetical protein
LEDALDPVERAGHDRELALDPVGREVRLRQLDQPRQLRRAAVELVARVDPRESRLERREERRVGVAAREVACVRRQGPRAADAERRPPGDERAPPSLSGDEPALPERPVRGGDGRRADLELGRQRTDRWEPLRRRQRAGRDLGLDPRRDDCGAGAGPDSLY